MTIDELLTLRLREERRLAESVPFSPEWDAAMAAVVDLDEALRTRDTEVNDAAMSRSLSTGSGWRRAGSCPRLSAKSRWGGPKFGKVADVFVT